MSVFEAAHCRLFALLAVLTVGFVGCTSPLAAPKISPFTPKPEMPPAAVRMWDDVQMVFDQRQQGQQQRWESVIAASPLDLREVARDHRPIPGTPWYEYLRTDRDFTSPVDRVLARQYKTFQEQAEVNDTNAALRRLLAGTIAFDLGITESAKRHFRKAVFWMEEATDTQLETLAALGRSDVKIYKGDSYERAMVHFYLGIIAYQAEKYEEARREFYRALLADQGKASESERGRFPLLHYWLGKTHLRRGDAGNAGVALAKSSESEKTASLRAIFDLDKMDEANLTVLVQLGAGPARVLKGVDWERSEYRATEFPERGCDILIDGAPAGQAILLADLNDHVLRQGRAAAESVQGFKSVVKGIGQLVPYASILFVGWDVRGDIRSWSTLPGRILVWSGKVPAGEHTVTVKFYDEGDYELTRYRQAWFYIPVESDRETVVVVRSGRDKCNIHR